MTTRPNPARQYMCSTAIVPRRAANAARLRTKQGLLDVLVERVRDQTSWTRAAVCKSWMALATHHRIPMGHWLTVTQLAIGELQFREFASLHGCAAQIVPMLPGPSGSWAAVPPDALHQHRWCGCHIRIASMSRITPTS